MHWLLLLALTADPQPARYRPVLDVPLTLVSGGGWLALDLAAPSLARTSCPCERNDVPGFDRFAIDARFKAGSPLASGTLALTLGGSALALALNAPDAPSALNDIGIATEAATLAGLATELAKLGFSRPYPYMIRSDITPSQNASGINYAAMWSGHTSVTMAVAVASARLLDLRGAPRALRLAMWIAGPLLAIAAGALEVSAANHFPSDVVVGALAGAGVGWGVVTLHTL